MYGKSKTMMAILVVAALCFLQVPAFAAQVKANTDKGYIGNDQWICDVTGDLVPIDDSSQDIGASGNEVDNIYLDSLWLGGVEKTSWGSVVSPMTDATGYVYPTDSGGVYRLYDAGYLSLGAGTAIDVYVLFDTDDDDWYFGRDDTDNDCAWGVGSTLGTDERISIVDNAALTAITIGDGVDSEDKYLLFDGSLGDQYIGYLDTYDMLIAGDGSTMDADMCWGVENATTPLLVLWNGIDAYGAIDIDYGSVDVTDHTFVSDGGTLIIDGTITLTEAEVISNATDDTVRVASNDAATTLEVWSDLASGDAILKLSAGDGDAAGEQWTITSTQTTTDLVIACDDTTPGDPLTRFTISDAGVVTTMGTVNLEIEDSANTSITDIANIQHFTSGTAAAGIGAGLTFDLENGTGTEEEHASIDVVATSSTNGAEDSDVVINQMTAGALAETVRIVANSSATTSDYLQFTANTTETTVAHPVLVLATATGTAEDLHGMAISFRPEDATGSEEHARMDIVQTTAARATNDTDFVFTQDIAGALTETVRFDADASLGGVVVIEGASPLAMGGTTDDAYFTILAVADAASSSKTVTLPSITSSIALETVATTVITANTTATITVVPGTDTLYTYTIDTDDENCTLTFSAGGTAGDIATIIFDAAAASGQDEIMTFHTTLANTTGTLTLADGANERYVITFISDGTVWNETSRTGAQT